MKHLWEVGESLTLCEEQIHWGRDKVVSKFDIKEVKDEGTAVQYVCSDLCSSCSSSVGRVRQDALAVVSLRERGNNFSLPQTLIFQ